MLDTFRATDNQTISASGFACCASFSERKNGREFELQYATHGHRPLVERAHTACRLRNLADFIFSTTTTTTMTVDDVGLDDSSRTHISQRVRSCGNFDIPEYSVSRERKRERKRGEILCPFAEASILSDTSHFLSDSDLHSLDSLVILLFQLLSISNILHIFCAIKMGP